MPAKINEGDKKQQELILVEAARYGTTSEASRVPSEPYRNPADIKIDVFKKMKRTDDTVKSGLYFVELAVVSKMGEYVNESNPEIQAFVRAVFQEMKGTLAGAVRRIL